MTEQQLLPNFLFENQAYNLGYKRVVGLDEAGRGPLAGPVVAAVCYIEPDVELPGVRDSKLIDAKERRLIYEMLISHPKVRFATGLVDVEAIDKINILQASLLAMMIAVGGLEDQPDYLIVDGNQFPQTKIPGLALEKGDQKSLSVAAASIIAKETRDLIMENYHKRWPLFQFDKHKGYSTREHLLAIRAYGITPIHRRSFEPIRSLVKEGITVVRSSH